jgi:xylulokinase
VVAGAGDQPAQALGNGIVTPGKCSVTIGTSGVVFAQGKRYIPHPTGLLHSFCHAVRDQWYLMGVMLSAGGSFQWLRNTLRSIGTLDYDSLTGYAGEAPPGSEGLIFLPYLTGERVPHDDPRARGAWIGLNNRHSIEHLVRSVLEGITFGLYDSLNLIQELGLPVDTIYASGGAVRSRLWLQMLADVFRKEIQVTGVSEGAAYGAAMLAGIGTGEFSDAVEAASALVKITGSYHPGKQESSVYAEYYEQYRNLYPLLNETFSTLTGMTKSTKQ